MGMIGMYVRLRPAEFRRALREPEWARELANGLAEAEWAAPEATSPSPPGAGAARCHSTDKAWHALSFLLDRIGFPVDAVHGDAAVPGASPWGYGPPRHLAPDRVAAAAEALAATPPDVLVDGVTARDLAAEDVYPAAVWQRGEPLEWVVDHYRELERFFRGAAREGDGMLVWID
ncbi:DUF1877 family protein [Streptomyces globosus]|uniref:DUF1877 family protein n=1 Tax=Streptomyces globosus TaxID=68209 RepID=UPI0031D992E1